jgi:hypothetical protein
VGAYKAGPLSSKCHFRQFFPLTRRRDQWSLSQLHCGPPLTAYSMLATGAIDKMHLLFHIAFFALWIISPSWALHQSEVGVVDWHKNMIGIPLLGSHSTAPIFHRVRGENTQSVILTATESNVLAALNPVNGSVGTMNTHFAQSDVAHG